MVLQEVIWHCQGYHKMGKPHWQPENSIEHYIISNNGVNKDGKGIGKNSCTSTGGLGNTWTAVSTHPPIFIPLRPAHALDVIERSAYCPHRIYQK